MTLRFNMNARKAVFDFDSDPHPWDEISVPLSAKENANKMAAKLHFGRQFCYILLNSENTNKNDCHESRAPRRQQPANQRTDQRADQKTGTKNLCIFFMYIH